MRLVSATLSACMGLLVACACAVADPLPAWNDGAAKAHIVGFVVAASTAGSKGFIEPADRIAVFDNDGTLWCEKPIYPQLQFALDRVEALSPQHPEWREVQPFKEVLEHDISALEASGEKGLAELLRATHTGMTTDAFAATVTNWLAAARDPRFH